MIPLPELVDFDRFFEIIKFKTLLHLSNLTVVRIMIPICSYGVFIGGLVLSLLNHLISIGHSMTLFSMHYGAAFQGVNISLSGWLSSLPVLQHQQSIIHFE